MTTLISRHLYLETDCTLIPTSEKKTISREDNKITVTFERALNYLKQALETYEIASFYKKYFAKIIYDAQIEAFKKSESNPNVIKNFEKNLENRLFQEINDFTPPGDVKFNTFKEIINLSLHCMTIDKKSGELFLVLNNRYIPKPKKEENLISHSNPWENFDWDAFDYYHQHHFRFLVKIDISEQPSISDWEIVAKDLKSISHVYDRDFWHNEWMYASMTSYDQNFSSMNIEKIVLTQEIDSTDYYKEAGISTRAPEPADYKYLDRKYLIIKRKDGSEQYFKSPFEEVPPLILDGDNEYPELLPLTTKKVTPGCYFIEKEALMEFLTS